MGKGKDWIREEVDKRLRSYQQKNPITDPTNNLGPVEFIEFTNPERTKGKTKAGIEVDTIPKGSVGESGYGIQVSPRLYVVNRSKIRPRNIDGEKRAFILAVDPVVDPDLGYRLVYLITCAASPIRYRVPWLEIVGLTAEQVGEGHPTVGFSPSGRHIFIGFELAGGSIVAHPYWGWAISWKASTSADGEFVIDWDSLAQNNIILDETYLPIPEAPEAPPNPGSWTQSVLPAAKTVTWGIETDPDFWGAEGDTSAISYSFVLYEEEAFPKTDIIGTWYYERIVQTAIRGLTETILPSGPTVSLSYSGLLFDPISNQTYRIVTRSGAIPAVTYYVNGTTLLSFAPASDQFLIPLSGSYIPAQPNNLLDWGVWNEVTHSYDSVKLLSPTAPYITPHEEFAGFITGGASLPTNLAGGSPATKSNTGTYTSVWDKDSIAIPYYWQNLNASWYIFSLRDGASLSYQETKTRTIRCRYEQFDASSEPTFGIIIPVYVPDTEVVGNEYLIGNGWQKSYISTATNSATIKNNVDTEVMSWNAENGGYLSTAATQVVPPGETIIEGGVTDQRYFSDPSSRPVAWENLRIKATNSSSYISFSNIVSPGEVYIQLWGWNTETNSPNPQTLYRSPDTQLLGLQTLDWTIR